MRTISVIGSGPSGLLAAIALLDRGYDVTVVSDRSAEQWLNEARPTGTAAIHQSTRAIHRKYGLAFYDDRAPEFESIDLHFSADGRYVTLRLSGHLRDGPGHAIDLRLQCHDWLLAFQRRGGRFVHRTVTLEDVEDLAASNDLVLAAAGRSDVLGQVFERDPIRSVYDRPQRHLCMFNVVNCKEFDLPTRAIKFNFLAPYGEYFLVPYYSATRGSSRSIVVEARPGGPMDRFFGQIRSGEEGLARLKEMIRELTPYEYEYVRDAELCDERSWLVGRFAPTVRKPVGHLPSGRIVVPIGDTVMACDPIGGFGANCGAHYSDRLVEHIVARGDRSFDAAWVHAVFEDHYAQFAGPAYTFNNMLLEPLAAPMREILIAGAWSSQIATDLFSRFNQPARFTETGFLTDMKLARQHVAQVTGAPWTKAAILGRWRLLGQQVRQRLARRAISPPASFASGPKAGDAAAAM